METQRIMKVMDASYHTCRTIERSLREIDRRALNAMVLVKRHGNKLAGYGVVAQAFRERAAHLKEAAAPLQRSVAPLVRSHMRILQRRRHAELFSRAAKAIQSKGKSSGFVDQLTGNSERMIEAEEAEALSILRRLVQMVTWLQEGIAEQEYVVTNGRIEAALLERSGAPLMRVSHEMGVAVSKVRAAIWKYRGELEEVLHEGSARV